jgi:hypothetical protein
MIDTVGDVAGHAALPLPLVRLGRICLFFRVFLFGVSPRRKLRRGRYEFAVVVVWGGASSFGHLEGSVDPRELMVSDDTECGTPRRGELTGGKYFLSACSKRSAWFGSTSILIFRSIVPGLIRNHSKSACISGADK